MSSNIAKRQDDADENQNPYGCAAYGCPLNGTISHGTTGGSPWYCAHHFDVKPEASDDVTTKIRGHLWLLRLAHRIDHIDPCGWEKAKPQAEEYVRRHDRPDLALQPDESRGKYVARLIAAFGVLVSPSPVHRETRPEPKKTAQEPLLLADLLSETA
jgi:hypothetical protein